jgi:hypothetical protein
MGAFRAGIRRGELSVDSACHLARATSDGARDHDLRLFARYHKQGLTTKQVLGLASATCCHEGTNALLERFARARIKTGLPLGEVIELSAAATRVEPTNRILDAFAEHHAGTLTPGQREALAHAHAVSSGTFVNVGGVTVGSGFGGPSVGGVEVGPLRIGGISSGGGNLGGR